MNSLSILAPHLSISTCVTFMVADAYRTIKKQPNLSNRRRRFITPARGQEQRRHFVGAKISTTVNRSLLEAVRKPFAGTDKLQATAESHEKLPLQSAEAAPAADVAPSSVGETSLVEVGDQSGEIVVGSKGAASSSTGLTSEAKKRLPDRLDRRDYRQRIQRVQKELHTIGSGFGLGSRDSGLCRRSGTPSASGRRRYLSGHRQIRALRC